MQNNKIRTVFIPLVLILIFSSCNYCEYFGSHDLGSNFTLLEGDKTADRLIIYCSPKNEKDCCYGGMPVIPSNEDNHISYIDLAKSNTDWIIAKAVNKDNTNSYWIIDKNFSISSKYKEWPLSEEDGKSFRKIIQSYVIGPLDVDSFNEKISELKIDLEF